MIRSLHRRGVYLVIIAACCFSFDFRICQGAVKLDALGRYLTSQGYGGAQLVDSGKFYHLPIRSNGKPGNLVIDTGSPSTLIFRSSVQQLGLTETRTRAPVSGIFGEGRERYGVAMISSFVGGNFTMKNIPVAIASDVNAINVWGRPNGLLGLDELVRFGAILDLSHRIVYLRPSRPFGEVPDEVKSILESNGWKSVKLSLTRRHLRVPGEANDVPCHFLVDTGAYLTALDREFVSSARIPARPTYAVAHGVGSHGGGSVGLAELRSLWIGNYQIKKASATVLSMDSKMLGRGTPSEVAGLLGVEYLALNSAIFDFVSGTLYLRPKSATTDLRQTEKRRSPATRRRAERSY